MRLIFYVFAILMFCCFQISAQTSVDTVSTSQKLRIDQNEQMQPVKIDVQQFEKYKKDKDFDYSRNRSSENWWESFKDWLSNLWISFWEKILGNIQPGSWMLTFVQIMKYVLILGLVGLVAWLFIRLNPGRAMVKHKASPEVLLSEDEKIIQTRDIPKLIAQAQAEQNYRLAVRYYYLLILKILKDKDLIDYQYQKTNQEYQYELSNAEIAFQFDIITHLYEFIWYGDFKPTKSQYNQAKKEFDNIEEQLNTVRDV